MAGMIISDKVQQKKYHTASDSCVSCKKYAMKYRHKNKKRLDLGMPCVINLTSDMEVRSFFYARK